MEKMDIKDAMARLGNNKKLYAMLLKKFDGNKMMEDLKSAVSANDADGAQAQAHAIKGLAANLSLTDLCEKAGAIEARLKDGGSTDEIDVPEIAECISATVEAVNTWLSENQ